jgi:hypothetical protein
MVGAAHCARARRRLRVLLGRGDVRSGDSCGPTQPFQLGQWRGGVYSNDQTGGFSHCVVTAPYKSGIAMTVFALRDFSWGLGFANPAWSLQPGTQIPISLIFDNGDPIAVMGTVIPGTPPIVRVPMPSNSQLLNSFRGATLMTALAQGHHFGFRLDGTSRLMPALANCVRGALAAEGGSTPRNQASETAIEEMRLATNFLLAAGLANARVIDRAQSSTTLAAWTGWKSDSGRGAVKIYHAKPSQSGLDLASELIAGDSQSCKGKFASARSSELVDDDVVVSARVFCGSASGETTLQYFITPFHKTDFAVFAVFGQPNAAAADRQAISPETYTKAALHAAR